jgi:hypothetical protein
MSNSGIQKFREQGFDRTYRGELPNREEQELLI